MGKEDSERDQAHVDRELDWFFKNASPNPDGVGCLSEQTLRELAQRLRPIGDPGYEHLSRCSPCYWHFRRYQSASRTTRSTPRSSGKLLAVAAGFLLIITAVTGLWWFGRSGTTTGGTGTEVAVVDLRSFLVTRGAQSPRRAAIKLSRADSRADILLPIGFETGRYEVRLVNSIATVLSTQAEAALENHVVTIHITMTLSNLHAGAYQLAVRREGDDWHFFPTTLE